jgi:hypothetical protein
MGGEIGVGSRGDKYCQSILCMYKYHNEIHHFVQLYKHRYIDVRQ